MINIIFFGTPFFSIPILEALIDNNYNIINVITQSPKKSNRGQKISKSPVHVFAEQKNLEIKCPKEIKELEKYFNSIKFDLAIVVAFGQIIPKNILKLSKYGFVNVHASMLPKYRGAAPIQRAIISQEKYTGISIMKMNENLDSGPVCNQYKQKIEEDDNFMSLSKKLSALGKKKIIENIDLIIKGEAKFKEQIHKDASYAKKIDKSESKIDWNLNAKNIIGKINGLFPHPGAWFEFSNERYKILKSRYSNLQGKPGLVMDDSLTVACGTNSIQIEIIQRQGKKSQKTKEFLLGSKIKKGSLLQDD